MPCATGIERAGRVEMLKRRHPHHGRDPDILGGDADLRRQIDRHRVVLHVDEQEIVAGGLHDLGDVDRARLAQPDPERQLARLQTFLGVIADRDHRVASLVLAPSTVDSALATLRTRPWASGRPNDGALAPFLGSRCPKGKSTVSPITGLAAGHSGDSARGFGGGVRWLG
jgi:hypothetical protein